MALKTRYTNVGGQVAAVKTGGQRYFVEPDALGNVRGLVNQSGVRSQTYTYWPYGEVRTSTGSVSQPLQFCGTWGYYTESSSKQYVRARYYMQSIGRWQTVDPLWPIQDAFDYVSGHPLAYIDPSGEVEVKPVCGGQMLVVEPGDEVGIITDDRGRLLPSTQCTKGFKQADGRTCYCANGGFWGATDDWNGPAQATPVGDVTNCLGKVFPGPLGKGRKVPLVPIKTPHGSIKGKPLGTHPDDQGKKARTGACVDKSGKLLSIIVVGMPPGARLRDFEKCLSAQCHALNGVGVLLDGSGSSRIVKVPAHAPPEFLIPPSDPRWVHNYIAICGEK